ncbi:Abi family protein [Luteibacter sp. dw_328]|uniref:Abi family protein n=1 Tax=Luteibacter sp. dw_328 TaxID=2719796 RepID=UPI0031F327F4
MRASYYLERVGYYRLMGYLFPFRRPGSDDYEAGATFEEAVARYEFDQVLRSLIMEAICNIEVAVRTAATYPAFGVASPVFANWIHAISAIRNIAAHHGRMWNRVLGIIPMRPNSGPWQHMAGTYPVGRMYFALLAIKALLGSCAADVNDWRDRVSNHLRPLLASHDHRQSMGAPANWDQHALWR